MKIGFADGYIRILEAGNAGSVIKQWPGMKLNRKDMSFTAPVTLELMEAMGKAMKMPPRLQGELDRLRLLDLAINNERVNPEPVPIVQYPVKANLFKHQIRAANMAMMIFDEEVVADDSSQT